MMNLTRTAAYFDKTPYDLWQESEEIPIVRGHCVEDLTAIPVGPLEAHRCARVVYQSRRIGGGPVADMCLRFCHGARPGRSAISSNS
jgi:hypothetical protein